MGSHSTERLANLPEVRQLERGRMGTLTQAVWPQRPCSYPQFQMGFLCPKVEAISVGYIYLTNLNGI